jgi:hypothetical protein
MFADGVCNVIDEMGFDGIYFDGKPIFLTISAKPIMSATCPIGANK